MKSLILVLLVLYVPTSFADWFSKPKNYDDCVLENMKGTTSDLAAKAIYQSCRNKFPFPAPKPLTFITLNKNQLKSVTGTANSSGKYFTLSIYNGSSLNLKQITVRLINNKTKQHKEYVAVGRFLLKGTATISPLSTGEFKFTALSPPKDWSWQIVSAKGMEY